MHLKETNLEVAKLIKMHKKKQLKIVGVKF